MKHDDVNGAEKKKLITLLPGELRFMYFPHGNYVHEITKCS